MLIKVNYKECIDMLNGFGQPKGEILWSSNQKDFNDFLIVKRTNKE